VSRVGVEVLQASVISYQQAAADFCIGDSEKGKETVMRERNLDFDQVIDRRNTRSVKYDFAQELGYPENVLPLWVADMDFKTSSCVEDALGALTRQNLYGYSNVKPGDGFLEAVSGWMKRRHRWEVAPEWQLRTPGVCFAIAAAIRALTAPGDAVLIQEPVYYPFSTLIETNGRKKVSSDLLLDPDGNYRMDFDDMERKINAHHVRLMILCSPHNPVGRVWTKEELRRVGQICSAHGVTVFSDEIHFDFVWEGEHTIFQEVDPSFREFTVTATSPSKTFNLAGLQLANIFAPNPALRERLKAEIGRTGYDEPNIFGITAAQAAYEHGDAWYEAMMAYVKENIRFAEGFIRERLPGVRMRRPEGTYLLWMDFRSMGMTVSQLDDLIIHRAGLWLDSGAIFGAPGQGFQRVNAACPRSILREALERLEEAMHIKQTNTDD